MKVSWSNVVLCLALVAAPACAYLVQRDELVLLLIPALSLVSARLFGPAMKAAPVSLFLLSFLVASLLLYLDDAAYKPWGVLAYAFFASSALVAIAEYLGTRGDKK